MAKVKVVTRSLEKRNETVLSDTDYRLVTAEQWYWFWGCGPARAWEDEALGAGETMMPRPLLELSALHRMPSDAFPEEVVGLLA